VLMVLIGLKILFSNSAYLFQWKNNWKF
jgi:hypothetical protein